MNRLKDALHPDSALQEMDEPLTAAIEETPYHCTVEWHMGRLRGMCAVVYSFAAYISRQNEGRFFCSAVQLGEYFDCDEGTVRRALQETH